MSHPPRRIANGGRCVASDFSLTYNQTFSFSFFLTSLSLYDFCLFLSHCFSFSFFLSFSFPLLISLSSLYLYPSLSFPLYLSLSIYIPTLYLLSLAITFYTKSITFLPFSYSLNLIFCLSFLPIFLSISFFFYLWKNIRHSSWIDGTDVLLMLLKDPYVSLRCKIKTTNKSYFYCF